jgi:hypothetical protein
MSQTEYAQRQTAIHLLRSGKAPASVAQELNRSLAWVYKWRKRFFLAQDWQALRDRSRAPKRRPAQLSQAVRAAIRQARSELEAEAAQPGKLAYRGAHAIQARLRTKQLSPLPSISSIERELRTAGMVRPQQAPAEPQTAYPHLHPSKPWQLIQVDIVPHYLRGGACVACFNAIDVVSRYPSGQQLLTKRAADALAFLVQVWQEVGIPTFTQVDNESCFSGGFTHPGVLGQVLRLALLVGTQLVFSPIRHPQSNGTVERFHQDYSKHVWAKLDLPDLQAVQQHSPAFFAAYRRSAHHSALRGQSPAAIHPEALECRLPKGFRLPERLPLSEGQVHFLRCVNAERQVLLLNLAWDVPRAEPGQGVWATLAFKQTGAKLRVYDTAPDASKRTCLAEHPFPLRERVQPLASALQRRAIAKTPSLVRAVTDLVRDSLFGLISTMW